MDEVYDSIYVSDRQNACELDKSEIDVVITVCQDGIKENVSCEYHHFVLEDGEHDEKKFKEAVEKTLEYIEKNNKILIHCHEGISRSPSVVIAALSIHLDIGVREALSKIREEREMINPAPELLESAKKIGKEDVPFTD